MSMKKAGLAALAAACCVAMVSGAEAAPKAKGKKARTTASVASKKTTPTPTPKAEPAKAEPAKVEAPKSTSGALPYDCSKGETDAHCKRVRAAGSLGAGPAIRGTSGFPSINDGFIDGGRLVVAVEMGAQMDDNGAIFGIDLTTGDRKILSGKIEDPAKGPVTVGTGPDLGYVSAVANAGSSWVAMTPKGVVRIDPTTGNRTAESTPTSCAGSTAKLNVSKDSIAATPDGTIYVAVSNAAFAVGILAYKGGNCSVVTMSGANGFESKGSGPTIQSIDPYRSLRIADGKIWALHGMSNSIITIDPATGNRARISSGEASARVGAGDAKNGSKTLALSGSKVWTAGAWVSNRDLVLTEASVTNGDRTAHAAGKNGPAAWDGSNVVWVHPTKPLLVLAMDNGIVLFDPATGLSNVLSN